MLDIVRRALCTTSFVILVRLTSSGEIADPYHLLIYPLQLFNEQSMELQPAISVRCFSVSISGTYNLEMHRWAPKAGETQVPIPP